ncbi:sulfurtransferase complex subunit TusB [Chlorobium sp.]|uniref:sulfurtransferase complex subunit TusB n=1 Tax=Chlorobium sp. TaxID=1095 RepID=UPI002F3F8783
MLHTINKSPFSSDSFETAVRFIQPGDPVLFIENGVYAVEEGNRFAEQLAGVIMNNPVYALQPDLDARGISSVAEGVAKVDYDGFVDLVAEHQVNSWL